MNKRGDIPSLVFGIVFIFIAGILIFLFSHVNNSILTNLDSTLSSRGEFVNTTVTDTTSRLLAVERSRTWDYGVLFIYIGMIISLMMTAYAVRVHVIFFWIYILISLIVLFLGVVLSNLWITMAENPTLSGTVARFPITNFILGSYAPTIITGILMLFIIFIFGKTPEDGA